MTMRGVTDQPFTFGRTTTQARQVCLGRRLVEEDKFRRIESALLALPGFAFPGDVGALLFSCMQRLFLYVSPSLVRITWIAATVQFRPRRCFISTSVASGYG